MAEGQSVPFEAYEGERPTNAAGRALLGVWGRPAGTGAARTLSGVLLPALLLMPLLVLAVAVTVDSGWQQLTVGVGAAADACLLWWAAIPIERHLRQRPFVRGVWRVAAAGVFAALVWSVANTAWLFLLAGLAWLAFSAAVRRPPAWRRLVGAVPIPLAAGALLGCAAHWVADAIVFIATPGYRNQVDFAIYYAAALALRLDPGADIYRLSLLQAVARAHAGVVVPSFPYLYPPLLALLLQPLTTIPPVTAVVVWTVLNLACWLACAALLALWMLRALTPDAAQGQSNPAGGPTAARVRQLAVAATLCMALTYEPMRHVVILGQISGVVLLLLLAVPLLVRHRGWVVAGGALALALLLKLVPAVLLAYYLARRRWGIALAAAGWTLAAAAATSALGVPLTLMAQGILHNGAVQENQYNNVSLLHVPTWIAAEFGGRPGVLAALLGYVLLAAVALTFAGALLVLWRRGPRAAPTQPGTPARATHAEWLGYAWAVATMVLVSPVTWQHYDVWLLAPVVYGLGTCLRELLRATRDARGRLMPAVYAAEALLAGYLLTMSALPFNLDSVQTFSAAPFVWGIPLRPLVMLLRPLGAVLIWAASGAVFWSAQIGTVAPVTTRPAFP